MTRYSTWVITSLCSLMFLVLLFAFGDERLTQPFKITRYVMLSLLVIATVAVVYFDYLEKLRRPAGTRPTIQALAHKIEELGEEIREREATLPPITKLSDTQRQRLADEISLRVASSLTRGPSESAVLTALPHDLAAFLKEIETRRATIEDRLAAEIEEIRGRGNINLIIGIVTTIAAALMLAFLFGIPAERNSSRLDLVTYYVQRLSLATFLELFAFFFLRLYKATLQEIKSFQNEITAVALRYSSLHGATVLLQGGGRTDRKALASVLQAFATAERNRVLGRGETTAEIESAKLEASIAAGAAHTGRALANRLRPKR